MSAAIPGVPVAERVVERPWRFSLLLPVLALALAAALLWQVFEARGPLLTVRTDDGHGLRPGDGVRYRGIEVGSVEELELVGALVRIRVRLARSAGDLAREGTRFWIARPVLGVEGVRGLETLVGARYLALLPGPEGGPRQTEFQALIEPPLAGPEDPLALEVVLTARERGGLARGAPVLYRGIPIGVLLAVGLASDGSRVELRARIASDYAELVRQDSQFFRVAGVELGLGLDGLSLTLDSLQSLWLGGVALATPTHPGARALSGERFELADEPGDAWREWRPALPLGTAWLPPDACLPTRAWVRRTVARKGWFRRDASATGWLVRGEGLWVGPADLLAGGSEAPTLELDGQNRTLPAPEAARAGVARLRVADELARERLPGTRPLGSPEDVLFLGDPLRAPIAVTAADFEPEGESWRLTQEHTLAPDWHGAAVLARADGAWLGCVLVEATGARIAPLP